MRKSVTTITVNGALLERAKGLGLIISQVTEEALMLKLNPTNILESYENRLKLLDTESEGLRKKISKLKYEQTQEQIKHKSIEDAKEIKIAAKNESMLLREKVDDIMNENRELYNAISYNVKNVGEFNSLKYLKAFLSVFNNCIKNDDFKERITGDWNNYVDEK